MKISTVAQMKTLDREATENLGIPETILMENAGEAAYFVILRETGHCRKTLRSLLRPRQQRRRRLRRRTQTSFERRRRRCLPARQPPATSRVPPKKNLDILSNLGVAISELTSAGPALAPIAHCDAVIDAIFGTGLSRPVEGLARELIDLIKHTRPQGLQPRHPLRHKR